MRSPAQIEASRDNGSRSQGPVTAQGKLRPGTRALGGVTGRAPLDLLLQTEHADELRALRDDWYARFQPIDEPERNLVDQITATDWRYRRCGVLEAGFWRHEMDRLQPDLVKTYENVDDKTSVGMSFSSLDDNHASFRNINRYETSLCRQMDRLLKRIKLLQSMRPQIVQEIEITPETPSEPIEVNELHDNPSPEPTPAPAPDPEPPPAAPEPESAPETPAADRKTPVITINDPERKGVWVIWPKKSETL